MNKPILFTTFFSLLATGMARDPLAINATELQKAYETNALAANQKYRDKSITVVGKIKLIYDMRGDSWGYLAFQGSDWDLNQGSVAICLFDNPNLLVPLEIGNMVQVRGVVQGNQHVKQNDLNWNIIWMTNCVMVRPYNGPQW